MFLEFNAFCEKHKLFQKGDRLLLAVSGGVDSMVLSELMSRCEYYFEVAHANFQLRGQESEDDAIFVEKWAESKEIEAHIKRFKLDQSGSIQEQARTARYEWFQNLLKERKLDFLVTAHHATDNVETLFINILRGSGAHGWSGVPLDENQIRRPLLFANKKDLLNFAESESIAFREDASNSTDRYLRNTIRHRVLPVLDGIKPNFDQRVSINQIQLRRSLRLAESLVAELNLDAIIREKDQLIIFPQKMVPQGFLLDMLFLELRKMNFTWEQCEMALNVEESGKVFLSSTHELLVDRERWIIRSIDSNDRDGIPVEIYPEQKIIETPISMKTEIRSAGGFEIPKDPLMAALDFNNLEFPLILRKWRRGDRFIPLGMKQHKLISDFLIDEKLNRFEKVETYVLESAGEIVWVVGHRISNNSRIQPTTRQVFLLTFQP